MVRDYFNNNNIYTEEFVSEHGEQYFRFRQSFSNGGEVTVLVSFSEDESVIDMQVFNIAQITNPLKKEQAHNLINELNKSYRFVKFKEHEGNIAAQYAYSIQPNEIDLDLFMYTLVMLLDVADDNYPKFMRLLWG